jgi:hypothetical protein
MHDSHGGVDGAAGGSCCGVSGSARRLGCCVSGSARRLGRSVGGATGDSFGLSDGRLVRCVAFRLRSKGVVGKIGF